MRCWPLDTAAAATAWAVAAAFLFAIRRVNLPWLARHWLHEHILKMMAAFLAVTATFTTTVLPAHQP